MHLTIFQTTIRDWHIKNFGKPQEGYKNLLGLSEELGELCHAHLKGEQGIKYTEAEVIALKIDAIGDIFIFLCGYCNSQWLYIENCIKNSWETIRDRSYIKIQEK
jgi:NTP pyrophosphatase (non-canonical NTP hydrolase)